MWQVKFYTTNSGKSPVLEFLDQLPLIPRAKVRNVIRLLQQFGSQLRQPYSKKLAGYKPLFELRTTGRPPIRLIYTIHHQIYIILHAFSKKTPKTPLKEIAIASRRLASLT